MKKRGGKWGPKTNGAQVGGEKKAKRNFGEFELNRVR